MRGLDMAMVTLDEYPEIFDYLWLKTEVGAVFAVIERMPDQPH